MVYFHVCPLLSEAEGNAGKERPNARNENIKLDSHGKDIGIIAAGKGTDEN